MSYARAHGLHVIVPRFFIHLAPRGVESLALHDFARQISMVERGLLSPPVLRRGQQAKHGKTPGSEDEVPISSIIFGLNVQNVHICALCFA